MLRSPSKAGSDSDLTKVQSPSCPACFANARTKRKHEDVSITKEDFIAFKNELIQTLTSWTSDLDSKLDKMEHSLAQLQSTTSDFEMSLQFISQQYEDMQVKIINLEKQCKGNYLFISSLEAKVEDLQYNMKKNNLEIRNLPCEDNESNTDLIQMMINLASSLNCTLQPSDIRHIYRIPGKKGTTRPVILELNSITTKHAILTCVRDYNKSNQTQKLNYSHFGISGTPSPVYIQDDLTLTSKKLYYMARQLIKQKLYKFCWLAQGKRRRNLEDPHKITLAVDSITELANTIDQLTVSTTLNCQPEINLDCEVIILTECWLMRCKDIIPHIFDYSCHLTKNNCNQNDGIVIYVKNLGKYTVDEPDFSDASCLVIKIGTDKAIICIYRSPSFNDITKFLNSLDALLLTLTTFKCIAIVGDINLDISCSISSNKIADYLDLLASHGILPARTLSTRDGACLDHVLLKTNLSALTIVIDSLVTDHNSVLLCLNLKKRLNQFISTISKIDYKTLDCDRQIFSRFTNLPMLIKQ
ncbi:unnamed protein product [Chilo suppressalis]|uniref:Endonuclease/exonuclease/phosphatase domain-containing protein n=1 Tax=Chilo suppressalis TaxID=168631 RepID=A0ABN8B2N4_CHISP|nr:unnamed protein product [Chilo suppressalis]